MEVRITKLRIAMAALFVLAGIGLGSLLSPLIGTALATVGTVSNISDHSASAYFAKVDSAGKLAVGDGGGPLTVDGAVTASVATPSNFASINLGTTNGSCVSSSFPTGKALIITNVFVDVSYPPSPATSPTYWTLRKGKTCSGADIVAEHPTSAYGGKSIPFDPGFGVPASAAGISLWIPPQSAAVSFLGVATYIRGYWVPAGAVP